MASTTIALSMGSQDNKISSEDITNDCRNITVPNSQHSNNDSIPAEDLQCFVCDAKIQGRHYALATCRTQTSRSRVIEKLGEIVGERYMVVISEDDMICRSCANLINTLDRLEVEMRNVRDNVLRFLEQKYSLEEGELLGSNELSKRSQPPQITKCTNLNTINSQSKKKDINLSTNSADKGKNKKNIWLQCDKCQYTTNHNSFMVHHIRDHIKQKLFCDKCGMQFPASKEDLHDCASKEQSNNRDVMADKTTELSTKDMNETSMDVPTFERATHESIPILPIQTYSGSEIADENDSLPLIRLSDTENMNMQNILNSDNTSSSSQPVFVRVLQPVDVNEDSTHSTMLSTSDTELVSKLKDNLTKQILTMTEDGKLEMVEVTCWNDVQSSESPNDLTFQ